MTKRNLLKVPREIIERISTFDQDDVVVACTKFILPEDIESYSQLGISMASSGLVIPAPKIPSPTAGRYSRANVEGREKNKKRLTQNFQRVFIRST